jgi:hypothetical protein
MQDRQRGESGEQHQPEPGAVEGPFRGPDRIHLGVPGGQRKLIGQKELSRAGGIGISRHAARPRHQHGADTAGGHRQAGKPSGSNRHRRHAQGRWRDFEMAMLVRRSVLRRPGYRQSFCNKISMSAGR